MKKNIYVIYDSKAQFYNTPFFLPNNAVAMRTAQDLLQDPNSEISRHPEDFAMFLIGEYDDEGAQLIPFDKQDCLVRFHEINTTE